MGAGCGAADLITVRGAKLLREADIIIYAGSLVNPELLDYAKENCQIFNSAFMTLEDVLTVIFNNRDQMIVRLHTGDPSLYGAIREQIDALEKEGISYDVTPGVTAAFGAAASLGMEYTLPDISQTLILTRMEGKTPVPEKEKIGNLAAAQASMAVYLSAGMLDKLQEELIGGGYPKDTPAAIAYKVSWPDEKIFKTTLEHLAETGKENHITKLALVLVGQAVSQSGYDRSKLYDPGFSTEYRTAETERNSN